MGWNREYTIFESTVMGAYDLGVLSKDLLTVLMEPYRGIDIDSVCARLLEDGVGAFEKSFISLLHAIEEKARALCKK